MLQRESPSVRAGVLTLRALDIALTSLALRAAPTRPPQSEKRLVPAVDDAPVRVLRDAELGQERAAMVASLWPAPTRQCVAAPLYEELPAPAIFGTSLRVTWRPLKRRDARALQTGLQQTFAVPKKP